MVDGWFQALLNNIKKTEPQIIKLFRCTEGHHEIWMKSNKPELIETNWFLEQKFNYIHYNPVKKQYVSLPEHWLWSSAGYYETSKQGLIKIDPLDV